MNISTIQLRDLKAGLKDYKAFSGTNVNRKTLFSKLINNFLSSYKKVSGKDKRAAC